MMKESAMRFDFAPRNRLVSAQVHPLVYAGMVGLALWFAVSAWGFASDGYTDYLLVVVSGLVALAVALLLILSRVDQPADARPNRRNSFRAWARGDLDTWQDRLKGSNAAIEILLPLAAVAVGMTLLGIVLHFAARSAGLGAV
jgi:hypothetical protein